jgi:antitoxin (DNA-binding transcriptional repressor) of toxin-antitoxin stability system
MKILTVVEAKKPVATIIPIPDKNSPREIGILDGKAAFRTKGDGKLSEEEFFGMLFMIQ